MHPLIAEEKKDVLDEELPAVNPFLSGAGASGGGLSGKVMEREIQYH